MTALDAADAVFERDVVLVVSSSRSGSSLLVELLQRHLPALFLQGECNPFFRQAGLSFPEAETGSDALDERCADGSEGDILRRLMAAEAGRRSPVLTEDLLTSFVADIARRLAMQWPTVRIESLDVTAAVEESLESTGWRDGQALDVRLFYDQLLWRLSRELPMLDARRYDGVATAAHGRAGHLAPLSAVVEEPPFILVHPWTRDDIRSSVPLVLKSPSHAYRLPFWERLVSRAKLRLLHLLRHPVGTINGLRDGWLFDGFHSHALPGRPLRIGGYSHLPGGDTWWKFDLQPGWKGCLNAPLLEVCAHQWRSAHRAVLEYVHARRQLDTRPFYLRVRFEDLVESETSRTAALRDIAEWIGLPLLENYPVRLPPPIMATWAADRSRWRRRADVSEFLSSDPESRGLADEFGYALAGCRSSGAKSTSRPEPHSAAAIPD